MQLGKMLLYTGYIYFVIPRIFVCCLRMKPDAAWVQHHEWGCFRNCMVSHNRMVTLMTCSVLCSLLHKHTSPLFLNRNTRTFSILMLMISVASWHTWPATLSHLASLSCLTNSTSANEWVTNCKSARFTTKIQNKWCKNKLQADNCLCICFSLLVTRHQQQQ